MPAARVRILIVGEEPDTRVELRRAVQRAQLVSAGEVGFGPTAVSYAAETRPDVILLSLEEPLAQALETAERLTQALPETPLIVCSSLSDPAMIRRAMLVGAQDYLLRPVQPAHLLEGVNGVLLREERRRLLRMPRPATAAQEADLTPSDRPRPGQGRRLVSFQIPPGKRAFTVPVNVSRSPAALIAPGDFVDVIAVMRFKDIGLAAGERAEERDLLNRIRERAAGGTAQARGDEEDRWAAMTVLQGVQVLAVQRQFVDTGAPYSPTVRGNPPRDLNISFVTLAVTPEQAQALALTVEQAKAVTLSLRPFGDLEPKNLPPLAQPIRPDDPILAVRT